MSAEKRNANDDELWPTSGLEVVAECPVCRSRDRELLHEGLRDDTFFAAPGAWTLWECRGCRSAYLDPRPDEATIGRAYETYYTHLQSATAPPAGAKARLRAALANGYRNARYGCNRQPSSRAGWFLTRIVPKLRRNIDVEYRFLPHRNEGRKGKVLDVGCGGGDWLVLAKDAGWHVAGSDPDPRARDRASSLGIEVRSGGAEVWADQRGTFDFASLSHVIEHVHDPIGTLRTVHDLLRPGGRLFIETPNIEALGHDIYGPNWRGIEAPRHLVLFTGASLRRALEEAGFVHIQVRKRPNPFYGLNLLSARMAAGADPYDPEAPHVRGPGFLARARSAVSSRRSELLTFTCERAPASQASPPPREAAGRTRLEGPERDPAGLSPPEA